MHDLTVLSDVLSVVSCLSSVELDCDAVFDADAVADTAASVFCVLHAFTLCPCSNDVVGAVAIAAAVDAVLICKKKKKGAQFEITNERIYITYTHFRAISFGMQLNCVSVLFSDRFLRVIR